MILAIAAVLIVALGWLAVRTAEETAKLDTLIALVMSTPLEDDE